MRKNQSTNQGTSLVRIKEKSMSPWELLIEAIAVRQHNSLPTTGHTTTTTRFVVGIILPMAVSQIPNYR